MGFSTKFLFSIVLVVVLLVTLFSIIGGLSSTMISSSESITNANNCSSFTDANGNALVYNITDRDCYNGSAISLGTAGSNALPLSTLFAGNGIIWLVFMSALLIFFIILLLKKKMNL